MVIAALFIIAKIRKQPKCPSTDEWVKMSLSLTHTRTHTHTQCTTHPQKKNDILPFAITWTDWKSIMLSEISQTEKDKYYMTSLICGI